MSLKVIIPFELCSVTHLRYRPSETQLLFYLSPSFKRLRTSDIYSRDPRFQRWWRFKSWSCGLWRRAVLW